MYSIRAFDSIGSLQEAFLTLGLDRPGAVLDMIAVGTLGDRSNKKQMVSLAIASGRELVCNMLDPAVAVSIRGQGQRLADISGLQQKFFWTKLVGSNPSESIAATGKC